jgi:redox-sensitive bicupin YhaK (pirin superfamily)
VARGAVEVGANRFGPGRMPVFTRGATPTLKALEDTRLMLLGGESLGERHIFWNFVSSRKERLEQAAADWRAGRFVLPPNDDREFIPLPESSAPSPNPMS